MGNKASYGYKVYVHKSESGMLIKDDFDGIKWELNKRNIKIIPKEYNKFYFAKLMPNQKPFYINANNQLCRNLRGEEIIYNTDNVEVLL